MPGIVRTIRGPDDAIDAPGIYIHVNDGSQFALRPEVDREGFERVPFSWASEFPALEQFISQFSEHWRADPKSECWRGAEWRAMGTYFYRFHPFDQQGR